MARRALLVAIARYEDPDIPDLNTPIQDVGELAGVLKDPRIGAFDQVTTVTDCDEATLRREIGQLLRGGRVHELLLIYLACHGFIAEDDRLYFAATSTKRDALQDTALPASHVAEALAESQCPRIVLMLDCCYAARFSRDLCLGGGGSVNLKAQLERCGFEPGGRAKVVIAASGARGYAHEGRNRSLFSRAAVDGLRSGAADLDGDGYVSATDLFLYVRGKLADQGVPQKPQMFGSFDGKPPHLAHRAHPAVAPRPPDPVTSPPPLAALYAPVPPEDPQFAVGRYLVTVRQFSEFLADPQNARWRSIALPAIGSTPGRLLGGASAGATSAAATAAAAMSAADPGCLPVVNVPAAAAAAYTVWAGRRAQVDLRLPTSDQWRAAARAGRPEWVHAELEAQRVNYRDSAGALSAVGEYGLNPYGIGDLLGNVWDLCTAGEQWVACGGSWRSVRGILDRPEHLGLLEQGRSDVGFRCAFSGPADALRALVSAPQEGLPPWDESPSLHPCRA